MDKKRHPLSLLQDTEKLLKQIRILSSQNSDIIRVVENDNLFQVVDRDDDRFYFIIRTPNQPDQSVRSFFHFDYFPQSEFHLNKASFNNEIPNIIISFNKWIALLRGYNSVNLTEDDYFTDFYEQEFFQEFEIVDADAEITPFTHRQQVALYNLLETIEGELIIQKNDNLKLDEVILETQYLKENIQNLSKKAVVGKLARILAKIKKSGVKLIKTIWDETRKEVIKQIVNATIDGITSSLH